MEIDCTFIRGNEAIPRIGNIIMVAGFYHVVSAILDVRWKNDGHILVKIDVRPLHEEIDKLIKAEDAKKYG